MVLAHIVKLLKKFLRNCVDGAEEAAELLSLIHI